MSLSTISDTEASFSATTILIPDHWRPEVEECLRKKILTPNARHEMVRTVVSQLFARHTRPDRSDCEKVARQMILKYPFTKDDMGCGYVSSNFFVELSETILLHPKTSYRQVIFSLLFSYLL